MAENSKQTFSMMIDAMGPIYVQYASWMKMQKLEKESLNNKLKHIFFSGDAYHSSLKKSWYEKIMKLTGWNYTKVRRNSLRP